MFSVQKASIEAINLLLKVRSILNADSTPGRPIRVLEGGQSIEAHFADLNDSKSPGCLDRAEDVNHTMTNNESEHITPSIFTDALP